MEITKLNNQHNIINILKNQLLSNYTRMQELCFLEPKNVHKMGSPALSIHVISALTGLLEGCHHQGQAFVLVIIAKVNLGMGRYIEI